MSIALVIFCFIAAFIIDMVIPKIYSDISWNSKCNANKKELTFTIVDCGSCYIDD